ncbi:hydrogenase maturation nickel metallochaperone HypA [Candidatus Woesearchaeota archaeon]|nr:hydrogenase maturation nickel metallochaperone HypA [Candidatus Woesearchaeota archaeon]
MHETVIADSIIKEANKHGKVKKIYLEIGELAHVPANELLGCLGRLVKWNINSKIKRAKAKCRCGFQGHPKILERGHDYFFIECPKCRKIPELAEGKDIKIIKIIVD